MRKSEEGRGKREEGRGKKRGVNVIWGGVR
jgi:hypothetical protein